MDSNEAINSFIEALYKIFPKYSRINHEYIRMDDKGEYSKYVKVMPSDPKTITLYYHI